MHQLLTIVLYKLNMPQNALVLSMVFFWWYHSMVDSIQISSAKTSILGLQSLRSHGKSTEPHRYLIRVSQGT